MTDDIDRIKNLPNYQIIEEISQRLKILRPAQVILFGSQAWGAPTEDSDVDLIVILDKEGVAESFDEHMADAVAVRKHLREINKRVALDVLVFRKGEWQSFLDARSSFCREILEKGIKLQ